LTRLQRHCRVLYMTTAETLTRYIETANLRAWTPGRGGSPRYYINNWSDLAGYSFSYYKTGNLSGASVRGSGISNRQAGIRTSRKVWIEDGALHHNGVESDDLAAIETAIEAAVAQVAQ